MMDFILLFLFIIMFATMSLVKAKVAQQDESRKNGQRAQAGRTMPQATKPAASASLGQAAPKPAAPKPVIVERAVRNNARFQEDETLKAIEEAHGHKETTEREAEEHSRNCQTLHKDENVTEAAESLLGPTEDLMVTGYSGNLHFERDFLGEAMDMLGAISVPNTDMPAENADTEEK